MSKFEPRVPQLIEFINRIIAAIETHPDEGGREVLVILEDLDKPTVDVAMDLFSIKGPVLTQPQCKIIFTVPTALLYSGHYNVLMQNFSKQFALPNFKIKEKTRRTPRTVLAQNARGRDASNGPAAY